MAPVLAEIEYPRSTQGPGFETLAPATSMMADSSFLVDVKVASVRSVDASMFGIESFDSGNEMNGNADEAFATAAAAAAAAAATATATATATTTTTTTTTTTAATTTTYYYHYYPSRCSAAPRS